jgi:periplasmic protein TonB
MQWNVPSPWQRPLRRPRYVGWGRRRGGSVEAPLRIRLVGLLLSLFLHGALFFAAVHPRSSPTDISQESVVTVELLPATPMFASTSAPTSQTPSAHQLPDIVEVKKDGSTTVPIAPSTRSPNSGALSAASGTRAATSARNSTHPAKIETATPSSRLAQDQLNLAPTPPSFYTGLLAQSLSRVKQYPVAALARRERGVVLLSMRLDRSGRLLSWNIVESSGYRDLDDEVSAMVTEAAPFPPFPALWNPPTADFLVPVTFGMDEASLR